MTEAPKKPTGIYLLKPTKTHGSRYEVELKRVVKDGKHVRWKTTSAPTVADAVKLEIAKKYVRWVIEIYPDLTRELKHELYKENRDVIDAFNTDERSCYRAATFVRERDDPFQEAVVKKRNAGCKGSLLPPECGITEAMIPKYVYYVPESDTRGDTFVIERHPGLIKEGRRNWQTTSSRDVPIDKKFMDALEKLTLLDREL
jgi:hypothetical protein